MKYITNYLSFTPVHTWNFEISTIEGSQMKVWIIRNKIHIGHLKIFPTQWSVKWQSKYHVLFFNSIEKNSVPGPRLYGKNSVLWGLNITFKTHVPRTVICGSNQGEDRVCWWSHSSMCSWAWIWETMPGLNAPSATVWIPSYPATMRSARRNRLCVYKFWNKWKLPFMKDSVIKYTQTDEQLFRDCLNYRLGSASLVSTRFHTNTQKSEVANRVYSLRNQKYYYLFTKLPAKDSQRSSPNKERSLCLQLNQFGSPITTRNKVAQQLKFKEKRQS